MTIVFSAACKDLIVMTVDAAITNTYGDKREYSVARKSYDIPGVGCMGTWGERRGNMIGPSFNTPALSDLYDSQHTFEDLDAYVELYLKEIYRPDRYLDDLDDVGYHIAGFDRQGEAHLYHRFWGVPQPNPEDASQDYLFSDHSPTQEKPLQLIYNGRNDIAETLINTLIHEIEADKDVGFDLSSLVGIACLGDFIARVSAELTPTVGPPFTTYLIGPQNRIEKICNENLAPIGKDKIESALRSLDVLVQSEPRIAFYAQTSSEINNQALTRGSGLGLGLGLGLGFRQLAFDTQPTDDNESE